MAYNYSFKETTNSAKAAGVGLAISTKESYEVCKHIRGKTTSEAKKILEEAIAKKKPIPYTRYKRNVGHRRGMAAGRYPINVCKAILGLIKSAEANAQFKGLSTSDLVIAHISAHQGPKVWHYGRHRRRRAKRTHIQLLLEEKKATKEKDETKKKTKPANKKEPTPAEKKAEPKEAQK